MRTKMCTYCGAEPVSTTCKTYCSFCYHRFQRIRRMYGKVSFAPLKIHHMHRAWNFWRQTAALDELYLDPIEVAAA